MDVIQCGHSYKAGLIPVEFISSSTSLVISVPTSIAWHFDFHIGLLHTAEPQSLRRHYGYLKHGQHSSEAIAALEPSVAVVQRGNRPRNYFVLHQQRSSRAAYHLPRSHRMLPYSTSWISINQLTNQAAISVVFFLPAFLSPFMQKSLGGLVLGIDIIFSYLYVGPKPDAQLY